MTTPDNAANDLAQAARLQNAGQSTMGFVRTTLRLLGAVFLITGLAFWPVATLPRWWILAVMAWLFVAGMAVTAWYYRGRRAYPRISGLPTLAYAATAAIWVAAGAAAGAAMRAGSSWWLSGLPWAAAGLCSAAIFWLLAARYGRGR